MGSAGKITIAIIVLIILLKHPDLISTIIDGINKIVNG
jgi:hypothetical protein